MRVKNGDDPTGHLPLDLRNAWARRPAIGRAVAGSCALVVEPGPSGPLKVVESRLTGKQHLEKAGVLAALGAVH